MILSDNDTFYASDLKYLFLKIIYGFSPLYTYPVSFQNFIGDM